jgi:hypothetical protein
MQNVRNGRLVFVRSQARPGGTPTGIDSGTDLGTFQCGGFARLVGMWGGISSATLRYQMGVQSGDYQVSSSFVVNSGPQLFDVLNFGVYVNFTVTAAQSNAPDFLIMGETFR